MHEIEAFHQFGISNLFRLVKVDLQEQGIPLELRRGADMVAGIHPGNNTNAILIGVGYVDPSQYASVTEAVQKAAAAADAELEVALDGCEEVEAEVEAARKLNVAKEELATVESRHAAARQNFDSALAAGEDPRPHRLDLDRTATEVADCAAWVTKLTASHRAAYEPVNARRAAAKRAIATRLLGELDARRVALRERVEAAAITLARELLEIGTFERWLK